VSEKKGEKGVKSREEGIEGEMRNRVGGAQGDRREAS
jgi:hypothetical protein